MTRYLLRRLLWLPILLLIVTMITYALGFYGPGDPVKILMGQRYDPETADRVRVCPNGVVCWPAGESTCVRQAGLPYFQV